MDAKTAVEFLNLKANLQAEADGNDYAANNYRAIADLIESQSRMAELGAELASRKGAIIICGQEFDEEVCADIPVGQSKCAEYDVCRLRKEVGE